MGIFAKLYDKTLCLAEHKHAAHYLALISFAESLFMPIPIDVVLSAMMLSRPHKSYNLALVATISSLFGGLLAYCLGALAFEPIIKPILIFFNCYHTYGSVLANFTRWGFWLMLLAGLIPIPYKLFTLGAGIIRLALPSFILAAIIGRGTRFFLLALLLATKGESLRAKIRQLSDYVGWFLLTILSIICLVKFA